MYERLEALAREKKVFLTGAAEGAEQEGGGARQRGGGRTGEGGRGAKKEDGGAAAGCACAVQ